jgi:hypothetical protein
MGHIDRDRCSAVPTVVAFSLDLPDPLSARGWKVKIRNLERNEPPHVTILHKTRAWRFDLRSQSFLDREPDPRDVPDELVAEVKRQLELLHREWDAMYPENPIESKEGEDD